VVIDLCHYHGDLHHPGKCDLHHGHGDLCHVFDPATAPLASGNARMASPIARRPCHGHRTTARCRPLPAETLAPACTVTHKSSSKDRTSAGHMWLLPGSTARWRCLPSFLAGGAIWRPCAEAAWCNDLMPGQGEFRRKEEKG
jgi:hypothetical protein